MNRPLRTNARKFLGATHCAAVCILEMTERDFDETLQHAQIRLTRAAADFIIGSSVWYRWRKDLSGLQDLTGLG